MECFTSVLALLTACFLVVHPSSVSNECEASLTHCKNTYLGHFSFNDISLALANRSLLTDYANATQRTTRCWNDVFRSHDCRGVTLDEEQMSIVFVADFLVTPGSIDTLVAVSTSECLTNPTKQTEIAGGVAECVSIEEQALFTGGNPCFALMNGIDCIKTEANNICGPVAGDLIQAVWDFIQVPGNQYYLTSALRLNPIVTPCEPEVHLARRSAETALLVWEKLRK